MANIESETINLISKLIPATEKSLKELTDAIMEILSTHKKNKYINDLVNYHKNGGEFDYFICKSFAFEDVNKRLMAANISVTSAMDTKTGCIIMMTKDIDRKKVEKIINDILVEQKRVSRLSNADFDRLNAGNTVISFKGLTATEVKLMQEQAKKYNYVMAVSKDENGKFNIRVPEKNYDAACTAYKKVKASLIGISGRNLEKQITNDLKNVEFLKDKLSKDPTSDFYIVSSVNPNECIHVTKDGYEHMKNGKVLNKEDRDNSCFDINVYLQSMSLVRPVVMENTEYEKMKNEINEFDKNNKNNHEPFTKKSETLNSKQYHNKIYPYEAKYKDTEREMTELINKKLINDKGHLPGNVDDLCSGKCSFEEFFKCENSKNANVIEEKAKSFDKMDDDIKTYAKNYIKETYEIYETRTKTEKEIVNENILSENTDTFIDKYTDEHTTYTTEEQDKSI